MQISDLVFIDPAGYHFADYPSFLLFLQTMYKDIYGQDVNLDPDTQDGQFVAAMAQAFYDTAALGASVFNSFSPTTAQGVGLSRNVKINGLTRHSPSNSTSDLTIVGSAGTVIIDGVAQDTLGQKWNLPHEVDIPIGGSIIVTATAQLPGAITAPANSINKIFTPTLGWQTVNNAAAATPGAPVETDAELRTRQRQSTADPSLTVFEGTIGGVQNLTGVNKVKGYENDTNVTDGNGLPPHSISLVVSGGDAVAIAQEILLHKTPGTQTFGTTTEAVFDSHGMPYNINFFRPEIAEITVQITLATQKGWSADYIQLIKDAVAQAINVDFNIGDTILITRLFNPAYLTGTPASETFDIVDLEIGKNLDPISNVNIPLDFDEEAVCDANLDITVIVT